jgi:hypothetical protein
MLTGKGSIATPPEIVDPKEAEQIAAIVVSTEKQLHRRYATNPPFLRGVHPKDHGCVEATFEVLEDLPPEYRVGVFEKPGRQYRAEIRFSNAAPLRGPDSERVEEKVVHGSRGMAMKLYGVEGARLVPGDDKDTQDFLMINQPVFAFANVADYTILSQAIENDDKNIKGFFEAMFRIPDEAVKKRALETKYILGCIASSSEKFVPRPDPHAFQAPPLSPLDNRYFSAAPFTFGEGWVAKFGAKPVSPETGDLGDAVSDNDYLRIALNKRLTASQDIVFEFQVQRRSIESLDVEEDIENACTLWDESTYPFETVARITIPPQDINASERVEACEALAFSPWHGLAEHRPLGSINRLRRAVYEKSAELRGCPVREAAKTGRVANPGVGRAQR